MWNLSLITLWTLHIDGENPNKPIVFILLQGVLIIFYIWTVEVYSMINKVVFTNLVFDILVVVGYIRRRWSDASYKSPVNVSFKSKTPTWDISCKNALKISYMRETTTRDTTYRSALKVSFENEHIHKTSAIWSPVTVSFKSEASA